MEVSYTAGFVSHPKGKHTIWGKKGSLDKQMLLCEVKLLKQLHGMNVFKFSEYGSYSFIELLNHSILNNKMQVICYAMKCYAERPFIRTPISIDSHWCQKTKCCVLL